MTAAVKRNMFQAGPVSSASEENSSRGGVKVSMGKGSSQACKDHPGMSVDRTCDDPVMFSRAGPESQLLSWGSQTLARE